ncbi:DUF4806 domain-containing protein [Aphis craccivora]|uniref:DUF4806 domain-containing protein n=1 Tax=Aphis craccivora TaxID=307492 RepID=A0A6G0YYE0_APHCR|nr:DUF4806 domain-containing protein [Aphis craccivora]
MISELYLRKNQFSTLHCCSIIFEAVCSIKKYADISNMDIEKPLKNWIDQAIIIFPCYILAVYSTYLNNLSCRIYASLYTPINVPLVSLRSYPLFYLTTYTQNLSRNSPIYG